MSSPRLLGAIRFDGDARYRVDAAGTRAVLIPGACRLGLHRFGTVGYRVTEAEGVLRVRCDACASAGALESVWVLRSSGPIATIAEIDNAAGDLHDMT